MSNLDKFIEKLSDIWDQLAEIFSFSFFTIAGTNITLSLIAYLLVSSLLLLFVSGKIRNILTNRILAKYGLEFGTRKSIGTIVYYLLTVLGFFIIIQTTGIDLTGLNLLAGALGVGIGFGLQNITNNFISGIIILFERPIKEGDRIELGNISGDVVKISARSTTVLTNDNISIIVPNSEFINSQVINWSHNNRNVRFDMPVGVAYKEDPEQIKKLLIEVAHQNEFVLDSPEPMVLFKEFGDSSLNFSLVFWTREYTDKPLIIKSQLYYSIFDKFKKHNIEIPFPQRDLHIKWIYDKLHNSKDQ